MDPPPRIRPPKYSKAEWEARKPTIERLYVTENRPLKEVMQILVSEYKFVTSEQQLKKRFPDWGFDTKYIKGDTMLRLARKRAQRRHFENKDSSFRVNNKPVNQDKIDRYLKRRDISEETLMSMPSQIDRTVSYPTFSVFTPEAAYSPPPTIEATININPSLDVPAFDFSQLNIARNQLDSSIDDITCGETSAQESAAVWEDNYSSISRSSRGNDKLPETKDSPMSAAIAAKEKQRIQVDNDDLTVAIPVPKLSSRTQVARETPKLGTGLHSSTLEAGTLDAAGRLRKAFADQAVDRVGIAKEEPISKSHRLQSPVSSSFKASNHPNKVLRNRRNPEFICRCRCEFCVGSIRLWSCDSCGEHGAMSMELIDHCPGCGHRRCPTCVQHPIDSRHRVRVNPLETDHVEDPVLDSVGYLLSHLGH